MSLLRDVHLGILLPHTAVVVYLIEIGKALDHNQSQIAKRHGLQLKVLDDKRVEVVLSHLKEQLVRRNRVGREHEHKVLWLVAALLERRELLVLGASSGVVGQAHGPEHAAGVDQSGMWLAALVEFLDNRRGGGCDISLGVALEHLLEGALELVVVLLGDIGQRVDKHELRHDLRQRIGLHHLKVGGMHGGVVVAQIGIVGLVVEFFLDEVHAHEVLDVVGILHRLAVLRVGKLVEDELPVVFRLAVLLVAVV